MEEESESSPILAVEVHGSEDVQENELRTEAEEKPMIQKEAVKIAILYKIINNVAILVFAWGSLVVLGDFASKLMTVDFWCVTVILLAHILKFFTRKIDMQVMVQVPSSLTELGGYWTGATRRFYRDFATISRVMLRTQQQQNVDTSRRAEEEGKYSPLFYASSETMFVMRHVAGLLFLGHLLLRFVCFGFCLARLISNKFGYGVNNLRIALNIFYALGLVEAAMFVSLNTCLIRGLFKSSSIDQARVLHHSYTLCFEGGCVLDGLNSDYLGGATRV